MNDDMLQANEEDTQFVPDDDGALPDPAKKIEKLRDELAYSEKERREYLDGWQRAKADLINYKKDEGKRFEDLMRYASAGFVEDILPVLDGLDMALGSAGTRASAPNTEKLDEGVRIIRAQLADILKKRGAEEIAVNIGDAFNPAQHESIGEIESEHPTGSIAEVSQKGYALAGRIIRPARVKLAKGWGDQNNHNNHE